MQQNQNDDDKTESDISDGIYERFKAHHTREVWVSQWIYFLFMVTFCNAPWQLQIAAELSKAISPGAFLLVMIFGKIIFILPILVIELFLGQYTRASFGQLYQCCPIFYGFSISCALLNLNYLMLTSLITCQSIIYIIQIILGKIDWQQCPENPLADAYNSTCYDARIQGAWGTNGMGDCEPSDPMHIKCSNLTNLLQFPALYYYWQHFQDPAVYSGEYVRNVGLSTFLVWVLTGFILLKGVIYLHKILLISLSFTVFVLGYFVYYMFFNNSMEEVLTHVFTVNWKQVSRGRIASVIWYIMWRTPVGYPNVYMTAAAYYDGPKIDPTFICFMLFIISDVYTAIFLMAFAVMTSTLSDSLGGNPDIYLIPHRGILYATIPEFLTGTNIKALFTFIYFVSFSVITLAQHVSFTHVFLLDIMDFFPQYKEIKRRLIIPFCCVMFLVGLLFASKEYVYCTVRFYFVMLTSFGMVFCYAGQVMILFIFYGVYRLRRDYLFATGSSPMLGFVILWVLLPIISVLWFPFWIKYINALVTKFAKESKCPLYIYNYMNYLLLSLIIFSILVGLVLFMRQFAKNDLDTLFKPSFLWGPPDPRQRTERILGGVVKTAGTALAERLRELELSDTLSTSTSSMDSDLAQASQYSMERPMTVYDQAWFDIYNKDRVPLSERNLENMASSDMALPEVSDV